MILIPTVLAFPINIYIAIIIVIIVHFQMLTVYAVCHKTGHFQCNNMYLCVCVGSSQEEPTSRNQTVEIAQRSSIVLTGDDILTIFEKLRSASKDWFNLGLALGMKITDLEDIEDAYRHNQRRLMKMVARRLEVTDPEHPMTWPYICECLRRPAVERNDVAEEIEDKYVRTATAVAHSATN